jgi:putative PIN family toxin of toxin-antitoxin system
VILSGLIWGGKPSQILERVESGNVTLFTSNEQLKEFTRILSYPKIIKSIKQARMLPRDLVVWLVKNAVLITPKPLNRTIIYDDPSDDAILACALTANVDFIISGDKKHLLPLKSFHGIPILTATQYLEETP